MDFFIIDQRNLHSLQNITISYEGSALQNSAQIFKIILLVILITSLLIGLALRKTLFKHLMEVKFSERPINIMILLDIFINTVSTLLITIFYLIAIFTEYI